MDPFVRVALARFHEDSAAEVTDAESEDFVMDQVCLSVVCFFVC